MFNLGLKEYQKNIRLCDDSSSFQTLRELFDQSDYFLSTIGKNLDPTEKDSALKIQLTKNKKMLVSLAAKIK